MPRFAILTDSSADLPDRLVRAWEVEVLPLSFRMGDADYRDCPDRRDMDPEEFYDRMRRGETAVTSAVTAATLTRAMSPPDPRRMVPGAAGDGAGAAGGTGTGSDPDSDVDSEPFWSRGLVTPHRPRSPKTVIPPIDDAITSLYEENP